MRALRAHWSRSRARSRGPDRLTVEKLAADCLDARDLCKEGSSKARGLHLQDCQCAGPTFRK